jgi:hypothetical protein
MGQNDARHRNTPVSPMNPYFSTKNRKISMQNNNMGVILNLYFKS